jgi:hypothetical protein
VHGGGELLWPQRFGRAELDAIKRSLGSYAAAGQLQSRARRVMRRLSHGWRLAHGARCACRPDRHDQPLHAREDDGVCVAILSHSFDEHRPRGRDTLGSSLGEDGTDHAADAGHEGPDLVPTGHDH